MKTASRKSITIAVILASVVLTGCGRSVNRAAERRIRDMLPGFLGAARVYRVHVGGDSTSTARGRLESVTIDGDDISLSNGLLVDHLHLELKNVEADLTHKQLRKVASARFTANIGEAALDEYLAGESPDDDTVRNVHIKLSKGEVAISADRIVLGLAVPFRAYGPLHLASPQKIELDPSKLVVVGIPVTGSALTFLKRRFESAIDLTTLPVPVILDQVQTDHGSLILSGSPDIAYMLRVRAAGD